MTEIEILRRRRELVLLSAKLQRATVVRRLENVRRHPVQAVLGLTSALSIPLAFKVGSILLGTLARKRSAARKTVRRGRFAIVSRLLPVIKLLPVLKMFPVLKFLNR